MIGMEVLGNVSHVSPALVVILFRSATGDIRPDHPGAGTSRRVDGRPMLCDGKWAVKVEVGVDGIGGCVELNDKLCLNLIEKIVEWGVVLDGKVRDEFTKNLCDEEKDIGFVKSCVTMGPRTFA